jgi:NADPH-dependent 2,4-dienoyl-CoA reductase/sulfur reductase-like enzyme
MTEPARPARADVLVVGAGPAGLAAAAAAWRAGARVVLLDAQGEPGGQYWRHPPGAGPDRHHDPDGYVRLQAALAAGVAGGGIDHRRGHQVWRVIAGEEGHAVHAVHAVRSSPGGAEAGIEVGARALVLATGAYERALPFPGWDVPGVLTTGAAQALLAEHGVPASRRVVVGGTGPFLLPVAAGLAEAGARVVGVFEAGDPRAWLSRWRDVAARPSAIGEGAGYLARLAWYGIRVVPRAAVVAAHGSERVEGVTVARLDDGWRAVPGSARRVECDAVAVGWGFTPRIELAVQAGCATRPGPDGAPLVDADDVGASSVPGVYAAGEVTGVAGAPLALVEGHAAGAAAAAYAAGRPAPVEAPAPAGLLRFAAAMHAAHPVRDGWIDWLRPDTLVCRCEEVPLARVEEAIGELGAEDARTVKLLTRCGMGWCQGRICGEAVARLVAVRAGRPDDAAANLRSFADRPLAAPMRLDLFADLGAHEGPTRDREPL